MTSPTTVEQPAKVPPATEVEQLTQLLVSAASTAAVVGFLAALPGVGMAAVKALTAEPEWRSLIELPGPTWHGYGSPVMIQHALNLQRRAAYLIMAARRLGTAVLQEDRTVGSVAQALRTEARHLQQHLQATTKRNQAAGRVRTLAIKHGPELGWYAIKDDRTSPECYAAHGSNFRVDDPPRIGYPGTVHPHCRCKPGPPFDTDRSVDDSARKMEAVTLARDDHPSSSHPDLPNKPGKTNWVEQSGGLPPYIKRVAKHIMVDSGLSEGHAIAAAHNWCVKQAAKGNAKAAAAIAQWNAKAAAARARGRG